VFGKAEERIDGGQDLLSIALMFCKQMTKITDTVPYGWVAGGMRVAGEEAFT
jgi:hypothetical protein